MWSATHVGAGTGGDPVGRETHFQASHERYVRKHHGTLGWWSYRAAGLAGAAARTIVLTGDRRHEAARCASGSTGAGRCGPRRRSAGPDCGSSTWSSPTPSPASSATSARWPTGWPARGHQVDVIGGAPDRMRAELDHTVDPPTRPPPCPPAPGRWWRARDADVDPRRT